MHTVTAVENPRNRCSAASPFLLATDVPGIASADLASIPAPAVVQLGTPAALRDAVANAIRLARGVVQSFDDWQHDRECAPAAAALDRLELLATALPTEPATAAASTSQEPPQQVVDVSRHLPARSATRNNS